MTARDRRGNTVCSFCGKNYPIPAAADACRDSHNLIYVPMLKEELNHLMLFIFSKDDEILDEALVRRLQAYLRKAA
jgi:hypothetical protein